MYINIMEKLKTHFLSLIVPVFKQEKTILRDLKQIKSILDKIRYHYEIIMVFDGMSDQSYAKIKNEKISHVKTLAYMKNQGKSYAIKLGMIKAKGDYVMFMDSGMEIDPNG